MVQTVGDELGRIPMAPALQSSLMRARDYASQQSHTQVTLEHLLLALTEDEDAAQVLQSSQIDLHRLRNDVAGHIGSQNDRIPGGVVSDPGISPGLTQILKYATLAAKQGRRPRIDGAIVLAAIVGDGRSMAAAFLKAQGLTFEEAIRVLQQVAGPPGRRPNAVPPGASSTFVDAAGEPASPAPPQVSSPVTAVARTARHLVDTEDLLAAARARVMSRGVLPRLGDAADPSSVDEGQSGSIEVDPSDSLAQAPAMAPSVAPTPPVVESDMASDVESTPAPETTLTEEVAETPGSASVRGEAQPPPLPWAPPPLPSMPRPSRSTASGRRPPLPAGPPPPLHDARHPIQNQPAGDEPPPRNQGPGGPGQLPAYPAGPPPALPAPPPAPPHLHRPPDVPPGGRPRPPAPDAVPRGELVPAGSLDIDRVAHSIPGRLRVGVTHSVEVRVDRPPIADGPGGRHGGRRGDPPVVRAASVRLRTAKGKTVVVAASPETLWDNLATSGHPGRDNGVWRFLITASAAGSGALSLQLTTHVIGPDGHLAERALPEQIIPIKVTPNISRALRRSALFFLIGLASIVAVKVVEGVLSVDLAELFRRLVGL